MDEIMDKKSPYMVFRIAAFLILAPCFHHPLVAQSDMEDDSVLVSELLIMDTLNLEITGPANDVAFYMNGLVFLSNSKYHQNMIPDHITFGQITTFFAPLEYISLESSRPLFPNDPFPYSPGGTCFTRDYGTVYFTKKVEIPGNRYPEKVFEMSIFDGKASVYNQLSFTAGPTRYMHPAISAGSDFMILSSDLSPSSGGLDLFVVRKGTSGWGLPVNLGPEINSPGHEWYPFLDQYNNLFFSSSGHMGYGGYDIYVCFFNGESWEAPQNLGKLVNSESSEIGFSIHPGRQMAIFSTEALEEDEKGKEQKDEILKLSLNRSAFVLAGIDPKNQDMSLLLKDMIGSGYTSAQFGAASELEVSAGTRLSALPLLSEEEAEPVKTETPAPAEPVEEAPKTEPEETVKQEPVKEESLINETKSVETAPPPPVPEDPNKIVFRIQILSQSKPNTRSSVSISGQDYKTWEYFYKGAYRITIGKFDTVQEASAFNRKCRAAGFNQSFVAAFRGTERETDPSVFKR